MLRLAGVRLLWSIPLLLVLSAFTFVLASLTPGNAARVILGTNTDPAAYRQVRDQLGLDKPVYVQYWNWLSHALRGDLGKSLFTGQPVTTILGSRLEVSLSLILLATLVCAVVGVALGVLSAVRGGAVARAVDGVTVLGMSVPVPWLGLLLVIGLSIKVHLFPATGYVPFTQAPSQWLSSLVLPVICLAAGGVAMVAKQTRGAMIDVLGRDFVRSLRANGIPARSIILRHGLKNAALPVVTVIGLLVIGLLGGTIVVEQLFALPGLGQEAVSATLQHDLPVLEGVVVYFTILVVIFNLLTDLAYGWLNPKVMAA